MLPLVLLLYMQGLLFMLQSIDPAIGRRGSHLIGLSRGLFHRRHVETSMDVDA
jgi:hypothetical protein